MSKDLVTIHIDGQAVTANSDSSIVEAARAAGIFIPTLCYNERCKPESSCMVCMVKIHGRNGYAPACATKVSHEMKIDNNTDEILHLRRKALELLLSEHLGDCLGPCMVSCPAKMDIPEMLRAVSSGDMVKAAEIVLADIPIPAILGEVCPAPCEGICRHRSMGKAIPICKIKGEVGRYILDNGLVAAPSKEIDKKIGIVGCGPAGLTAGYYLRQYGYQVTLFDKNPLLGGGLLEIENDRLPLDIIATEIKAILSSGCKHRQVVIGKEISMQELVKEFDAVLLATGELEAGEAEKWGLCDKGKLIDHVDRETLHLNNKAMPNVFVAGGIIQPGKMSVRAVAMGHRAAESIRQMLRCEPIFGIKAEFNTRIGKVSEAELEAMVRLREIDNAERDSDIESLGAEDCLHCDCRAVESCKLRKLSEQLGASATAYKNTERREYVVEAESGCDLIYEPGKCVKCGLCIQISRKNPEQALAFTGRGYNTRVTAPYGLELKDLSEAIVNEIVEICPTGAMSLK